MQTAPYFDDWKRTPGIAKDHNSTWTSALVVGDRDEDVYEMVVVGEPDHDGPATFDVLAMRDGEQVVIFDGEEDDFPKACAKAAVMARRASIRIVE